MRRSIGQQLSRNGLVVAALCVALTARAQDHKQELSKLLDVAERARHAAQEAVGGLDQARRRPSSCAGEACTPQALAGPAAAEGRQQAGAMAMRPASAEEQQLDMLDYANRMVGAGAFARLRWLGGPIGLLVCCMCACCTYWLAGSRACRVSMQARLPFHQPDTSTRSMRSTLYPHPRRCLATPPSAPGSATLWRRR